MVARRKNAVARSLKSVRAAKGMPVQRIELRGSVRNVAKLLCNIGIEVIPKTKGNTRYRSSKVFFAKGIAAKPFDDITLTKAVKTLKKIESTQSLKEISPIYNGKSQRNASSSRGRVS